MDMGSVRSELGEELLYPIFRNFFLTLREERRLTARHSVPFMAKDHTFYCRLVHGPRVKT